MIDRILLLCVFKNKVKRLLSTGIVVVSHEICNIKQDKGRSVLPFSRTNEAAVHRRCSIELTWFCFGSVNPFRNSTRSDDGLLASPFPINHSIKCEYYQPYARFLG